MDVNVANKDGRAALFTAAWHGQQAIVEALLGFEGIDANATGEDGMTAATIASIHGHIRILEKLLDFTPEKMALQAEERSQNYEGPTTGVGTATGN